MSAISGRKKGLLARALEHSCVQANFSDGLSELSFNGSSSKTTNTSLLNGKRSPGNIEPSSKISSPPEIFQHLCEANQHSKSSEHPQTNRLNPANIQIRVLAPNSVSDSPPTSPSSPTSPSFPPPEIMRKRRVSQQSTNDGLKPIIENEQVNEEQFSSTQHLRSGFFRTIKKQYPTLGLDGVNSENIISEKRKTEKAVNNNIADKPEEEVPFMSSMARKRLKDLRKTDPKKVDVATGLQWIRLELHEMREQDKSLFLQLIKLHSTIKEFRNELKFMEESYDNSFESIDGLASYWWPRCNEASFLPDFSSSDGAHLLMNRKKRPFLRRGSSFHYPQPSNLRYPPAPSEISSDSLQSSTSLSSLSHNETTL